MEKRRGRGQKMQLMPPHRFRNKAKRSVEEWRNTSDKQSEIKGSRGCVEEELRNTYRRHGSKIIVDCPKHPAYRILYSHLLLL